MTKINCKDFEPLIQGYLDGDISIEEKSAVEKHIKGCEACRHELAELEKMSHMLSSLEKLPTPKDFLQNVRAKIDAKQSVWQRFTVRFSQPFRLRQSFGVAAILVAFIALFMWANLKTRTNQLSRDTKSEPSPSIIAMKDKNEEMPLMSSSKINEEKPGGAFYIAEGGRSKDSDESSESNGSFGRDVIAKETGAGLLGNSVSKPVADEVEIGEDISPPTEIARKDSSPDISIEEKNGDIAGAGMGKGLTVSSTSQTESEKKAEEPVVMLSKSVEKKENGVYSDSTKMTTKMDDLKLENDEKNKEFERSSIPKGGSAKGGALAKTRSVSEAEQPGLKYSNLTDIEAQKIIIPIKDYNQDIKAINTIINKEKAEIISVLKNEIQKEKEESEISTIVLKTKENNLKSLVDKLSAYNREKEKAEKSTKYAVSIPNQRTITVIITVEKP